MMRRYAIIIGAMKCGTTSLTEHLKQHPQVSSCGIDEPNFFVDDDVYARGIAWYEGLFEHRPETHRVCVENSGNYTKHPYFACPAERIARAIENPLFVYLVRDPVDRVVSHFNFSLQHGWVAPGEKPTDERFLIPSRYAMQLELFEAFFPRDSILVVRLEDMARDPGAVLARVQTFLGVDVMPLEKATERHNVTRPLTRYEYLEWRFGLRRVTARLPGRLRKAARRFGAAPAGKVTLSAAERASVARRLEQDSLALRERFGVDPRGEAWAPQQVPA